MEQDKAAFDIKNLKLVDGTDPENALHRTFPRRALVESAGELRGCLSDSALVHIRMQPHKADIFLVVLEEKRRKAHSITKHDKKHTGDLRIERSCMSYLAPKHPPNPCRYLMA
jgi:hypothetical protein